MPYNHLARALFWFTAAAVLFLALVPGPLGQIVKSDAERHFMAFLVLPVIAFLGWPRLGPVRLWLGFAIFGAGIELAQWAMQVGRAAQWEDFRNDMIATSLALGICWLVSRILGRDADNCQVLPDQMP